MLLPRMIVADLFLTRQFFGVMKWWKHKSHLYFVHVFCQMPNRLLECVVCELFKKEK